MVTGARSSSLPCNDASYNEDERGRPNCHGEREKSEDLYLSLFLLEKDREFIRKIGSDSFFLILMRERVRRVEREGEKRFPIDFDSRNQRFSAATIILTLIEKPSGYISH